MKIIKKAFCLVLVILTVFSCCGVALGAQEKENYPLITVCGLGYGCVNIYYENDPEHTPLFYPIDANRLIGNVGNVGDYIVDAIKKKKPDVLHNIIYNYIADSFGMLALTPEGENMPGVANDEPFLREMGENKYEFICDNRQYPFVLAAQLREAIDEVREKHGTDKVELIGSSYGANVVAAFVHLYPEECHKLDTVMLRVPSIGGINFIGELCTGNFTINPIAFCDFIHRLAGEGIIPDFCYLMEEAGILDVFLNALVVPVFKEAVYDAVADAARDYLATLPALWVSLPDSYFEDAMIFMYGEDYKNPNHKYAKLIKEMTFYHYEIANKVVDIFTDLDKNVEGLDVAMITKYGIAAIPLGTDINLMDDGLVTVPVSSFGATCATYGGKLPDNYVQQRYTEYNLMSPERDIDASTGAFPFRTWYIKGLEHTTENTDYLALIDEIIFEDIDIFSKPNRPQFLAVSEENPDMLEIVEAKEDENTLYDFLFGVYRKIFLLPKTIFEKIKNMLSVG